MIAFSFFDTDFFAIDSTMTARGAAGAQSGASATQKRHGRWSRKSKIRQVFKQRATYRSVLGLSAYQSDESEVGRDDGRPIEIIDDDEDDEAIGRWGSLLFTFMTIRSYTVGYLLNVLLL